jgi:beta-glucosidase
MPGPAHHRTVPNVEKALADNLVQSADIDKSVMSLLKLLRRTGKFTHRQTTPDEKAVDLPEHRALIRQAGADGMVLLKNEDNILPIAKAKTRKIALLGPLAKYAAAHGGGSASLNCHYKVSPWDAFQSRLGDDVELTYSQGMYFLLLSMAAIRTPSPLAVIFQVPY